MDERFEEMRKLMADIKEAAISGDLNDAEQFARITVKLAEYLLQRPEMIPMIAASAYVGNYIAMRKAVES